MTNISFYEARTHFSALLDQVAKGKKILITRHGLPAAMLSPPPEEGKKDVAEIIGAIKALRRGNKLGKGMSIRDLIEEGRRF
jgi:prevent-host-death family protein